MNRNPLNFTSEQLEILQGKTIEMMERQKINPLLDQVKFDKKRPMEKMEVL